ncbi:MAG: CYTH and CHAD domain-containing protein [Anaerolineae bacterium]
MEEIELRFIVPNSELFANLRRLTTLGPLSLRALGKTRIVDHYLDTYDQTLQQRGWTCRLRHQDDRWLVTLKAPSSSQDACITRTELEIALEEKSRAPVDWPSGELREKVIGLVGEAPLVKLVTLRQARWRALVIEGGRQIAELSLDRVDYHYTGVRQRTYLLECELLPQGVQSDLDYIATFLVHHFCLFPDTRSKMLRALEMTQKGNSPDYDPSVRYQPRTMEELLERHDIDPDHAVAVADTAERLYIALQPLHHLDNSLLPSLRVAAMLHDIGRNLGKTRHQRRGYAQMLLQPIKDMPDSTRLAVAASAYLHCGGISAKRLAKAIPDLLPPANRESVLGIAALVRMATGLSPRSYSGAVVVDVDTDGHKVVVNLTGTQSHKLRRRIKRKSDLWQRIDGKKLKWHFLKEPLAQASDNTIGDEYGITTQDSIQIAGAKILAVQLTMMINSAKAVRLAQDPEAVHDLRVASRRMRSAFRLFGPQLVGSRVGLCRQGLRACAMQLGDVRNYEVQLELTEDYKNSVPSDLALLIDPLVSLWTEKHQLARRSLVGYVEGNEFANLISQLQELVQSQDKIPVPKKHRHSVCEMANEYLRSAASKVLEYDKVLTRSSLEELHVLRIECKRLRYCLEFFSSLLAGDSTIVLARLVDVQTLLGTLHDWYVSLADLNSICTLEQSAAERQGISNYRAYCYTCMNQSYIRFLSSWRGYANPRIQHTLQCLMNGK